MVTVLVIITLSTGVCVYVSSLFAPSLQNQERTSYKGVQVCQLFVIHYYGLTLHRRSQYSLRSSQTERLQIHFYFYSTQPFTDFVKARYWRRKNLHFKTIFPKKVAKFCLLHYGEPFALLVCLVGSETSAHRAQWETSTIAWAAAWPTVTSLHTPTWTRRHKIVYAILSTSGIN